LIDSIPIYGPGRIPELLEAFAVRRVLLAIPSASRRVRRRIVDLLEAYPVHVQTIPNMDEMVSGRLSINDLRDIDIGDLLGRESVPAVAELLAGSIRDRVVMISGAGGSIGSELCRKALLQGPKTLVLYERNEFGLYSIERELQALARSRGIPPASWRFLDLSPIAAG
jgi:FlaA1/EpsC-like NDP-sugar epimerase